MHLALIMALLLQLPQPHFDLSNGSGGAIETVGGQAGVVTIPLHWYDFHKDRDGVVTVKLKADLRAPIYHVHDLTDPKADFLVIDPSYAHADHFSIKGKKGHKFSYSVAGRP